ncbi:fimbrial protein [uncultured Mediterranea sp.]|uniref:fimbrial protein n=1 Tax=uncultured Mediterranea sp. TaxID=1926662 RepID=UPI002582AC1A|nr:fimbrial protein [uncultured Mediterranea sp.]
MNKFLQFVCLAVLLVAVSCVDDTFMDNRTSVQEGLPTTVRLKFDTGENWVITRAEQNADLEERVNNLYVLVFDGAGNRHEIGQNFFTEDNDLTHEGNDYSRGAVSFSTTSLGGATIVAIANLNTSTIQTSYDIYAADLDNIMTLSELERLVMTMNSQSVDRGASFMMTGYAKKGNETVVDIPSYESGQSVDFTLQLERTDAKVKFEVTALLPEDKQGIWTNFSFRPTGWTVKQVPEQSLVLPSEDGQDAEGAYFNSLTYAFEKINQNQNTDGTTIYTGGSFAFYMPENRKPAKQYITPGTTSAEKKEAYALRSYTQKNETTGERTFVYADPNSTYVEITGLLSYFDESDQLIYANVRFTIHLGYVGSDPDPNDYNTLRNHAYTYHITVSGVDDIKADVEDGEDRPGYEGDVVENFEDSYDFDCHYDRRVIRLHRSGFEPKPDGGGTAGILRWGVSTPFSKGVHEVTENPADIKLGMRDYRWIKFAVNKEYGVDNDKYVKYPGDQNYNDPFPLDGQRNNEPSPYYSSNGDGYQAALQTDTARLRDVNQLMVYLKKAAVKNYNGIFDDEGYVYVTAFVDENVYAHRPTKENPVKEEELTLWKQMAETEDRQLYIIVENAEYSVDGQSSIIKAQYSFRQRSVQTIYNVNNANLETGWGLETIMEGDRLPIDEDMPTTANSPSNGRYNTWTYFKTKGGGSTLKWTNVLNVTGDTYGLNVNRQNVFYATLLRNRDLDGDDIVDENEVRWYLASINQLTDIYLAEYALDYDARLYPWSPQEGSYPPGKSGTDIYWHYASSTYQGSYVEGDWLNWVTVYYPYVVWAEEGPSKGNYSASKEKNGSNYAYRCVRNLGIPLTDMGQAPIDVVDYDANNRTFDLSRMNPKALRTYYVPGASLYPPHDEKDQANLPYKKFEVSGYSLPYRDTYDWNYYQTHNPFSTEGYRVPNMRELLIFTSRMGLTGSGHLLSFTSFSMKNWPEGPYYEEGRQGYSYNRSDGSMGPGGSANTGVVYGVCDLNN